jgi:predicted phage gp36 major capsid-like protein
MVNELEQPHVHLRKCRNERDIRCALFHAKRDYRGHYLLMGKPVFISNSLPDIGATNKAVLFGDFNRLLIRHVPAEAAIRRYDELYMVAMAKGFEMIFRADAAIMHAGGSGDDPIKVLQCHA